MAHLAQDRPTLRNRFQKQIHAVGLEETELRWIMTHLVVANPTDPTTRIGFVGFRHDHAMKFVCRMSNLDVEAGGTRPVNPIANLR